MLRSSSQAETKAFISPQHRDVDEARTPQPVLVLLHSRREPRLLKVLALDKVAVDDNFKRIFSCTRLAFTVIDHIAPRLHGRMYGPTVFRADLLEVQLPRASLWSLGLKGSGE